MAYTQEQIEDFRAKDLRIHKSGLIKSYVENHGELPPQAFLDEGIKLIYGHSEMEKDIIKTGDIIPF